MKKKERVKQNAVMRPIMEQQKKETADADKLKLNAVSQLSALKKQIQAPVEIVDLKVGKENKPFVKLSDEHGENFFEIVTNGIKGAKNAVGTFVKVAGALVLLNTFMSCVTSQPLRHIDLNNPDSFTRKERTAVPNAGEFSKKIAADEITAADMSGAGASARTTRTLTANDINNERNDIAARSLSLARDFVVTRAAGHSDKQKVSAGIYEYLTAISDTITGSGNSAARTGHRRTDNQMIEERDAYYRSTGTSPTFVDGGIFLNDQLVSKVTSNITSVYSEPYPAVVRGFKNNLQIMHAYTANPTDARKRAACERAIDDMAELLSLAYDFDKELMDELFIVIRDVYSAAQKVIQLENNGVIDGKYRYTAARAEVRETSHGGGNYGSNRGSTPDGSGSAAPKGGYDGFVTGNGSPRGYDDGNTAGGSGGETSAPPSNGGTTQGQGGFVGTTMGQN
jgi:hypothetical protein